MVKIANPVHVYALGGLCEVGKNTYCIENNDSLIIIDAGVKFPDGDLPGISYVIPDYTKLKNSRHKVKALFITHGHEDHIGGIPFLIQNLYIPVIYAPKLAAALIRHKLGEQRIKENVKIVEYDSDSVISAGDFKVTFFAVTHSIPDAYGICVDTSEGRIVHTGDFKIDLTPVGRNIELNKIARIGEQGVELLLSDSTNAEIEGYTPSERNVIKSINDIFENSNGRIIISTFSSNISRIQQIVESAVAHKRFVAIVGRSMENAVNTARAFGYIKIPDMHLININQVNNYKNSDICILCTGSQGEPMAALSRIANDDHKDVKIYNGDTVVFSSSPIPGNGIMIEKVVNALVRRGAEVLTNSCLFAIHSSGHPAKQELRIMLSLVKPKYFMPIHGEFRMLSIHGSIANSLGMPKENIFIKENGDSIILQNKKITHGVHYPADPIYIDGKGIDGLNTSVIKDREILKNDGLISVVVAINSKQNTIISEPSIVTRGFIADNKIIKRIEDISYQTIALIMNGKATFNDIKKQLNTKISEYVYLKTERKPMIIPVVIDRRK